jgi:peroxiredoxin
MAKVADEIQKPSSNPLLQLSLLQFLDPQVAEFVGLAFLAVVLDGQHATGVHVIFHIGGDHPVDFDFEFLALAGDAVGVPVIAFEGIASALAEGFHAFGIGLDRADEPHAAALVIQTAGPLALRIAINLGLVTIDFVGLHVSAEHEAAVGFAFRKQDIAFKDEVAVGFLRDDKEFFVASQMDLAIDHFDGAPLVRIAPAGHGLAIEKRHKPIRIRSGARGMGHQQANEGKTQRVVGERTFHGLQIRHGTAADASIIFFSVAHLERIPSLSIMAEVPSTRILPLGSAAPELELADPAGNIHTLDDLRGPNGLLVMFVCNHCPFVIHLASALASFATECETQGIGVVAINSNDIENYPADAPDKMVTFAQASGWTFPYLLDADQTVAKAYVAACTPDFYLFDGSLHLTYCGQFDSSRPRNAEPITGDDLRRAVRAQLDGEPPIAPQRPSTGCNIKWKPGQEPDHFAPKGA